MIIESNVCAPVLLNELNFLRKEIKCSVSLTFYLFSQTRLISSIKHEHSCKILNLKDGQETWVKVFRIIPEFKILRMTFHRKTASKC